MAGGCPPHSGSAQRHPQTLSGPNACQDSAAARPVCGILPRRRDSVLSTSLPSPPAARRPPFFSHPGLLTLSGTVMLGGFSHARPTGPKPPRLSASHHVSPTEWQARRRNGWVSHGLGSRGPAPLTMRFDDRGVRDQTAHQTASFPPLWIPSVRLWPGISTYSSAAERG